MVEKEKESTELFFTKSLETALSYVSHYPVTLVEAPMGFGKTTAVKALMEQVQGRVLWHYVQDEGLTSLWTAISDLLINHHAVLGSALKNMGFPMDSSMRRDVLSTFDALKFDEPVYLVLDDLHLVESEAVNALIEAIAREEYDHFHLIITTRFASMEHLEELKLKGLVHYVPRACFELSSEDIIGYFKMKQAVITRAQAKRLYQQTEGWISSLYLMRLQYLNGGGFEDPSSIYELIEKAIYRNFTNEVQTLLKALCLFPHFTLKQARFVWKDADPEPLLKEVLRKNAFITYDREKKVYNIHNLFSNVLKEIAARENLLADLHLAAGHWYDQEGQHWEAMLHFSKAGAHDLFLTTFMKEQGRSIYSERKQIFIEMMEACPDELLYKEPLALLTYGINLMTFNEIERLTRVCGMIGEAIYADPDLDLVQRNQLLGEFEVLVSFSKFNDIAGMAEHHARASALTTQPIRFMDKNGGWWSFGCPSVLSLFHRESGKLDETLAIFKSALSTYYSLTSYHGAGSELIFEGECAYLRHDFETAEIFAHKGYMAAKKGHQPDMMICAQHLLMRVAFAKGNFMEAQQILEDMRMEISLSHAYHLGQTVELCECHILGLLDEVEEVPQWLYATESDQTALNFPALPYAHLVFGRLLISQGEYAQLVARSEMFFAVADAVQALLGQLYTKIYLAVAYNQLFRAEEAEKELGEALQMAEKDGLVMPFVENYSLIENLLEKNVHGNMSGEFLKVIRQQGEVQKMHMTNIKETFFCKASSPLTARETQIVELALLGLTNKAIGEKLLISTNTVKSSMKIIFEKQGITSRALLKKPS